MEHIIEELLEVAFAQISANNYKLMSSVMHYGALKKTDEDILYVYDKPKPTNNHSHTVEIGNETNQQSRRRLIVRFRVSFRGRSSMGKFLVTRDCSQIIKTAVKFMQQHSRKIKRFEG